MNTLRRVAVACGVAAVLTVPVAGPAVAAPAGPGSGSTGTAPAGPNLEVLSERYNLARMRAEQAERAVSATRTRMETVRHQAEALKAVTQARAAELYRNALGAKPIAWLDGKSIEDVARRTRYTDAADAPDVALIAQLARSLQQLQQQEGEQRAQRDRARSEAAQAERARRTLLAEAAVALARGTTSPGDGAGPVGAPRVQTAGAPTATTTPPRPAPSAPTTPPPTSGTVPPTTPPPTTPPPPPSQPTPPPPSSRAATAVAFARAQLGKPYVFATAGPNTYDCSGLTMAAWRAAGVSMAHYSGSQATSFPKVGWSQLQPGDIVVFYSDYHHVGLYIGGGQMIHAPQTGDVVKIAPAWRTTFQFGVRPG